MPDIDAWAGDAFPLAEWTDDVDSGVDNARLVADKLTSITVTRWTNGAQSTLAAQSVRLEDLSRAPRFMRGDGGTTSVLGLLIIGYKGHPTVTDTDLRTGDEFAVSGQRYKVQVVVPGLTNSLQAYAEVMS